MNIKRILHRFSAPERQDVRQQALKYAEQQRIAAFISIPRNASNTIRHVLKLGKNRDHDDTNSLILHENHQRGLILNRKYNLQNAFTFCFVRNPYDRCVSWFQFHKMMKLEPYTALTFREWIFEKMPHHWTLQNETDFQKENLSPLLQSVFTEGCTLDYIGRVENFADDLKAVVNKLNAICENRSIPCAYRYQNKKLNTSYRSQSEAYYTPASKDVVYQILKEDFQQFGYCR